ncbi:hypothetical protein [Nocardia abscessus]|uniref:hypothetical protein n=1 Tax=Nocardia abscessus TaxID=120957 RepID=UPI002458FB23|nr:hypothetical protein [Nocardia abscessus]
MRTHTLHVYELEPGHQITGESAEFEGKTVAAVREICIGTDPGIEITFTEGGSAYLESWETSVSVVAD